MKIGKYDCNSIEMGKFVLDGGAMFGVVPKVLWERKIPADDFLETLYRKAPGRNGARHGPLGCTFLSTVWA